MKKKIFLGRLERFNYELTVIDYTEKECREKLMKEYLRSFMRDNPGVNPKKELWDPRYSNMTFYEVAEDSMSVIEMEIGKVEWL